MVTNFTELFPKLIGSTFRITSPKSDDYNCIAWAIGADKQWWWPSGHPDEIWPTHVPLLESLSAFILAFRSIGYQECDDEQPEQGFDKIAIFAKKGGIPRLPTAKWSKS